MNTTHRTRRLSLTLAGLAAAALALPAGPGTATAASHRPQHHAAPATVQQTQNGLTVTDLKDLAKMKRDLSRRLAQQTRTTPTVTDPNDLGEMKRDIFRRLAERSPRR